MVRPEGGGRWGDGEPRRGAGVLQVIAPVLPLLSQRRHSTFPCGRKSSRLNNRRGVYGRSTRGIREPRGNAANPCFPQTLPKCTKFRVSAQRSLHSIRLISGLRKGKRCRKKRESPGETTRTSYKSRKHQFGFNLLSKYEVPVEYSYLGKNLWIPELFFLFCFLFSLVL